MTRRKSGKKRDLNVERLGEFKTHNAYRNKKWRQTEAANEKQKKEKRKYKIRRKRTEEKRIEIMERNK